MTHHDGHGTMGHGTTGTGRHDIERLASLEDWQLENDDQDLRGHTLFDPRGHAIGRVKDMLVDLDQERVRAEAG